MSMTLLMVAAGFTVGFMLLGLVVNLGRTNLFNRRLKLSTERLYNESLGSLPKVEAEEIWNNLGLTH